MPRHRGKVAFAWVIAFASVLALAARAADAQPQNGASPDATGRENAALVATLVRTTLVALDQANITGNYTVFRDLAAPSFRDRNSDATLALIFAPLRRAGTNLSAVVVLEPELTAPPVIDNNRMLHIQGTLATTPEPVRFELLFQAIDNRWRLYGVSVNPEKPDAKPAVPPPANQASPILPGSLVPPSGQ